MFIIHDDLFYFREKQIGKKWCCVFSSLIVLRNYCSISVVQQIRHTDDLLNYNIFVIFLCIVNDVIFCCP